MGLQSVGLSRFRKRLNQYSGPRHEPVVATSKETRPHYISLPPAPKKEVFIALKEASRKLVAILDARGIDAEDIIRDFEQERQRTRSS